MGWTGKTTVWIFWTVNTILSLAFAALAAKTFDNVREYYDALGRVRGPNAEARRFSLLGLMAGTVLGLVMVVGYSVFTFIFLFLKWVSKKQMIGSMYSVIKTASLYTSAFMLLDALTLHASEKTVRLRFSSDDENLYAATFYAAYVLVGTYLLMFLVLSFCKHAFTRETQLRNEKNEVMLAGSKSSANI